MPLWVVGILCLSGGCGRPGREEIAAEKRLEPVAFSPTVAVQLRLRPEPGTHESLAEMRTAIEEEIKKKKRVKLVADPSSARLLIEITCYLDERSGIGNADWYYRLQIVDTQHDVVIFEDGHSCSVNLDDLQALRKSVQWEFQQTAQWLEKTISISPQIEVGKDGVAFLETSPYKNERITYGRYDLGKPVRKVYVDYQLREVENTLPGLTLMTAVNSVYKMLQSSRTELVNAPDKADLVLRITTGSGAEKSYVEVIGGLAPPPGSYGGTASGAALNAKIEVLRKGETAPVHMLTAQGKAPEGSSLTESPESLSLQSFESALGSKLGELLPFLKS